MAPPLVLASASPRRHQLLGSFGWPFEVRPADIDETPVPGEPARTYVERLAADKASAVARPGELVIGADTIVELDGELLGKPGDAAEAITMLRRLGGRTHRVHTGVAVVLDGRLVSATETTEVQLAALDDALIEWYVTTGEPFGKAGAYAAQGAGGIFVTFITGSISNVIGLPLWVVLRLFREHKVDLISVASRRFGDV
jgi:septum formation protein